MTSMPRALDTEIQTRLALSLEIAKDAGRLTQNYFERDNYQVERKSDASPVTIADRAAEHPQAVAPHV